ncbi:amino acid transporter [Lindgomyces ingoldianus]|uniref:Amino acid transporter n=1 Tax=Lindgomyces ingoldianus TaxID=673940 RepID=A0ACB6QLM9_9PLEO|nr:amino acid transporter [Lindgomyces ingoldianus]KAF2467032.1 amino acid transporter [Lindgomyces ingoldianus]
MEWWHAGILMLAETISLGVLALPQAVAILGLVPGLLLILGLGLVATYTGYIIGQFKEAYPAMQSFADCGELVGRSISPLVGCICREIMAASQVLILVFIMGAHILSFAIAMNAMTDHATCTITFSVAGLVVCFVMGLPRTLKAVSYLSVFSCVSVIVSVAIAMIAIGVTKPDMGHIVVVHNGIPLVKGLGPVMNIVLAYAGHVAFFGFCSELKKPRDFPKALAFMQISAISFYMLIAAIIYYYAGPLVASPALGSASPIVRKICFGIAVPTIIIAGVINGSVGCKYIYVRIWKGTNVIHQNSVKSLGSWIGICAVSWAVSWIIAEAVPNFNLLLGLIAALFCSWFSFCLPASLWLWMNHGRWFSSSRKVTLTILNIGIFCLGATICIMGMWSSGVELRQGSAGKPFSCESNWHPMAESNL